MKEDSFIDLRCSIGERYALYSIKSWEAARWLPRFLGYVMSEGSRMHAHDMD